MIDVDTVALRTYNSALRRYGELSRKNPDAVLEHKGRDLGIRLYRGYRARRWRGARGKGSGIAWRQMKQRSRRGIGIRLRAGLQPSPDAPQTHMTARRLRGAHGTTRKMLVPVRTSMHQKLVYTELQKRQGGIGVLAASFLWYRRRSSQARGTYYVRNKTGRPLGYVEKGDGYLRIVGTTVGLGLVDDRYRITDTALAGAAADMVTYIQRKERENYEKAMAALPAA